MGHYVYQYLHPEYGHLYCGRTGNLSNRIKQHNNFENDNIPREYEELLKESVVMYIQLKNKAQEIAVETYCIDKYKPYLNKFLKYNDDNDEDDFVLEMKLPKWKIYDPQKSKRKNQLSNVKKEEQKIIEEISNIENDIRIKKEDLNRMKFELKKMEYESKIHEKIANKNILFEFNLDDIKWFYKNCNNKNVKFYSEVYDKIGDMVSSGCVYYNSDKDRLELKYWSITNKDRTERVSNDGEIFFELIASTLYNFYPDINIYPELYASLLSKKDELLITNDIYDLKYLMENFIDDYVYSVDRKIGVRCKNKKINRCSVILDLHNDIYKGTHNLPSRYDGGVEYEWEEKYGIWLVDENRISFNEKEDIDVGIKDYIFSCEYYHPNRDEKEEEYCNKMLLKYKEVTL